MYVESTYMSEFEPIDSDDLVEKVDLDSLSDKLSQFSAGYRSIQSQRMGNLLLNPTHLKIWVNAKPHVLH